MTFAVILVVTAAATLALRNPIKKWPMLFYALAVIVDVLFVVGSFVALPRTLWSGLFLLVQKCTLSLAPVSYTHLHRRARNPAAVRRGGDRAQRVLSEVEEAERSGPAFWMRKLLRTPANECGG